MTSVLTVLLLGSSLGFFFFFFFPCSVFISVLESHSRGSDARPGCRRLLSLHDLPFTGKLCIKFWLVYVLTLNPGKESFLLFDDKLHDKDDEGIIWQGNCHGSLLRRNVLRSVSLDTLSSNRKISCRESVKRDSGCAGDLGIMPKECLGMMKKAR